MLCAAITGGVGIWSTHFIAMLAHHGESFSQYDELLTLCSVVEVVGMSALALRLLGAGSGAWRAAAAGLVCVSGVAGMHFLGMAALSAEVKPIYDASGVALALAIASMLAVCAFVSHVRTSSWRQVVMPAFLLFLAVAVLHFSTMASTGFSHPVHRTVDAGLDRAVLTGLIAVAAVMLALGTSLAMFVDRYLTDLRGFTHATLEGICIVRDGVIVDANERFAEMVGVEQMRLAGRSPSDFLVVDDEDALLRHHDAPVEAWPRMEAAAGRELEVVAHVIEYQGCPALVLAARDLTEKKAALREVEHLARHDVLTGLPNRLLLEERIDHAFETARRDGRQVGLIAIDLDRFKAVNDVFGHATGDEILRRVAAILTSCCRSSDTLARIGGDEFVVLQCGAQQPEGARALASRILDGFAAEMDISRDPTAVGVSLGAAVYPDDASDAGSLRHNADIALYRAKRSGRGRMCFFDRAMDDAVRERRELEQDLRHALLRRQMHVAFQPIVETGTGQLHGYEALMRWRHPERGDVDPEVFVPIAEETGLIIALGEWILRSACATAASWPEHLTLAINLSAVQFRVAGLAAMVIEIAEETGFDPRRLELEITESVLMSDREDTLSVLRLLKAQGARIVMDDFGTGYSSLSNLQAFPFDKLKIDRSFVASFEDDAAARSVIRAIVGIGSSLGLPVVAEGVETEAQHSMVIEAGCPQAQGYLFGRPVAQDGLRHLPDARPGAELRY